MEKQRDKAAKRAQRKVTRLEGGPDDGMDNDQDLLINPDLQVDPDLQLDPDLPPSNGEPVKSE